MQAEFIHNIEDRLRIELDENEAERTLRVPIASG
jgi:hypothetical protein